MKLRPYLTTACGTLAVGAWALLLSATTAQARGQGSGWVYEVEVTNITKGTNLTEGLVFTPILLATHRPGIDVFELGQPAGEELAKLAEGGDTAPLAAVLEATEGVYRVMATAAPLPPGGSVVVEIPYDRRSAVLSLASMLLPTNDGFIGLNGATLPWYRHHSVTHTSPGYDAGSEINDELCASIPGPHCGGEGYSPSGGEGKVHVHSGIHGIGDLEPEHYDWRNPVVQIRVKLKRK